ncbi:hypothetical protein LTS18_009273 [Coniosporium uncinatum]|uniref:Uncharacterized protein n=1 Tax=Coniosporium uncinatum TaxID=93489 RepID=A0ACC3DCX6_9PEZI|nr:hypothetical protein LTS18_009273 [Coniosporium uncinatum]
MFANLAYRPKRTLSQMTSVDASISWSISGTEPNNEQSLSFTAVPLYDRPKIELKPRLSKTKAASDTHKWLNTREKADGKEREAVDSMMPILPFDMSDEDYYDNIISLSKHRNKISRAMSPTLVRIAFVFSIDKDNSFNDKFISTRAKRHAIEEKYKSEISVSDLELYYMLACKEAEDLPDIFSDREYYMKLWYEDSGNLPHVDDAKIKALQDLMEAKGALIADYLRREETQVDCDLVQEDVANLGLDAEADQEMNNKGSDEDIDEQDDYPIVELRKQYEAL